MKIGTKQILSLFLTILMALALIIAPSGFASAASEPAPSSLDETNVLDDLNGSVLNGKEFSLTDWGFNERRDPEIVSFVEFGYSAYASRQQDYGLYVYVYNPHGVAFDTETARNQVSLAAGTLSTRKRPLIFLNYSEDLGTEGMFYKFKLRLSEPERQEILGAVSRDARAYKLTELEISVNGQLTAYPCVTTYTYSGFAQGYGSELATESTLLCKTDGFEDYAELNVHQTVYRMEGDYYEGEQAQLNSCFFRVPEKYYEAHGDLSKIVCEWYEYVTKPILITEDGQLYRFFNSLNGGDVPSANDGYGYAIFHAMETDSIVWGLMKGYGGNIVTNCEEIEDDYSVGVGGMGGYFEIYKDLTANGIGFNLRGSGKYENDEDLVEGYTRDPKNPYSAMFWTGESTSYKEFGVTADELEKKLTNMSKSLGEPYLGGMFSETLFSEDIHSDRVRGFNHREIAPEDPRVLFSNFTVKDAWEKFWGGYKLETNYESINAICEVTADDLKGTDKEIAQQLYIDEKDVTMLKQEFDTAQKAEGKERVILLRYADSKYYSIPFYASFEATSGMAQNEIDDALFHDMLWKFYNKDPFDGYIAQETVYLDFDIISLWFQKNGVETEIPVVMTPQNVFSPVTPPLNMDYHEGSRGLPWYFWLILALILIVVLIVLSIFFPVLKPIFAAIGKVLIVVITFPFRLIAMGVKKISDAVKRRRAEKAAAPQPPERPTPQPEKKRAQTAKKAPAKQKTPQKTSAKKTAPSKCTKSAKKANPSPRKKAVNHGRK